jgi:fatty acid desaturase
MVILRRFGKEMQAQLARSGISLVAMLIALVIFMKVGIGWLSVALMVLSLLFGFSLSEMVFRRLADHETIRRDLEERVRNQHL